MHARGDEGTKIPRIRDLGRRPYAELHQEMLGFHASVRQAGHKGEVWLVEHEPVYTAGRATSQDQLSAIKGVVAIERGGQITWHGPGQLVIYPLVPLPRKDVTAWLSALEAYGVAICARFGMAAVASVDGTGVFVGERKVASIGVAIRHWINLHGISVNVDVDLGVYEKIRPCGLDPSIMSDLSRELGRKVSMQEAKAAAELALPTLLEPRARTSCKGGHAKE